MNLKKTLAVLVVLLAGAVSSVRAQTPGDRSYSFCDPFKSTLCIDLTALYEFEEGTGSVAWPRSSSTGPMYLLEPNNNFIASSATYKTGAKSFPHAASANSFLYGPKTAGFSGTFSAGFWLYVDTLPATDTHVSRILAMRSADDSSSLKYPFVALIKTSGSTKLEYCVKQAVTDTVTCATTTDTVSAQTWYYVTFGQYPTPSSTEPHQLTLFIERGATARGNRAAATSTFGSVPGVGDLILGEWANTGIYEYGAFKVDQLAFWNRVLNYNEITKLINGGSGRAFPFDFEE